MQADAPAGVVDEKRTWRPSPGLRVVRLLGYRVTIDDPAAAARPSA
jgi:hypothetical protein